MNKQIHLIISYAALISSTFASINIIDDSTNSLQSCPRKIEFTTTEKNKNFQSDEDIFKKMTVSAKKTVYNHNYLAALKSYFWRDNNGEVTITE